MEKEEINILLLGFMAFKIFLIQFLRLVRYLYIYDKHELASKGALTSMKLRRASPTPAPSPPLAPPRCPPRRPQLRTISHRERDAANPTGHLLLASRRRERTCILLRRQRRRGIQASPGVRALHRSPLIVIWQANTSTCEAKTHATPTGYTPIIKKPYS